MARNGIATCSTPNILAEAGRTSEPIATLPIQKSAPASPATARQRDATRQATSGRSAARRSVYTSSPHLANVAAISATETASTNSPMALGASTSASNTPYPKLATAPTQRMRNALDTEPNQVKAPGAPGASQE